MSVNNMINDADPTGSSRDTLSDGEGVCLIENMQIINGFNSGLTFIAEVRVESSSNQADQTGAARKISLTGLDDPKKDKNKRQWGRVKSLLAALYNIDPFAKRPQIQGWSGEWSDLLDYAISEAQPLSGYRIAYTTWLGTTDTGYKFRHWNFKSAI